MGEGWRNPGSWLSRALRSARLVFARDVARVRTQTSLVATLSAETATRVRACAELPVALGFGIASPEQVAEACRVADAAVVGSALVNVVAEHAASSNVCAQASEYVQWLKKSL